MEMSQAEEKKGRGLSSADYLSLVKKALLGDIYPGVDGKYWPTRFLLRKLLRSILPEGVCLYQRATPREKLNGTFWPVSAYTMIGARRLENIQYCVEEVLQDAIEGDLIETGVWRGGASIFMRAVLRAHGNDERVVWVADSFAGLPRPNDKVYPEDRGDLHYLIPELAVSLEQVKANFEAFGLLDEQVKFLQGWFKDTLPLAPFKRLAVARLDGDLYESTADSLKHLYPKLSAGGYLIVDDYHAVPGCRQAVLDFREQRSIREPIMEIDGMGVYWRKET